MNLKPKEVSRQIKSKTRSQRDIAQRLGISESYLSLLKSGVRKLNPSNTRHVKLFHKLQSINYL